MPAISTSVMRKQRTTRKTGATALRLAERDLAEPQDKRNPSAISRPVTAVRRAGVARECRTDDQELAHEQAKRRHSGDRDDAKHQAPSDNRMRHGQAADLGNAASPACARARPRRRSLLVRLCIVMQEAAEIGERVAEAERRSQYPCARSKSRQTLDVAPPVQH
jgi:hypothetical protein